MAKTVGPLMSLDASGAVAGTIVFSKWKGRNYVRQLVTPANPQTDRQRSFRASMAGLVQLYKVNRAAINSAFLVQAQQRNISPFNAFTGFNQKRLSQNLYAANSPNPANVVPTSNATSLAATVAGRYITLSWVDALDTAAWEFVVYRRLTSAPTGTVTEIEAAVRRGLQRFEEKALPPGTYQYAIAAVSTSGGRTAISLPISVIVV
jgi:hypothetical protein